jgi:hypothetical protein
VLDAPLAARELVEDLNRGAEVVVGELARRYGEVRQVVDELYEANGIAAV